MADTPVMSITTPLEDVLLFHAMHGREELGRISDYEVSLLSEKPDVELDAILGKSVTIHLALPDDSTRHWNGYVTRFSQGGRVGRFYQYHARVNSWLWFLTRTADCRIFQEMDVPAILKQVFDDHATASVAFELTGSYRKWTYCVQYRETDFNFVSRLMEEEGIYYHFRHEDGKHTMVLTDSSAKHEDTAGYETLIYIAPGTIVRKEFEHISSWDFAREVQPGSYVHDDYDLERPSVELRSKKVLSRSYSPSDYEIYDYPGHYIQTGDGNQYASVRIEEFAAQFQLARAFTNARGVSVGTTFTLDQYPRDDQNAKHLVIAGSYDLEFSSYEGMTAGEGSEFRCSFTAMPIVEQFRTRRLTPKPFVQGPQTAVVVGPGGDEIFTDKYGRVKVQFHWDRRGKKDENSSCWVRVSHPWAGKNWGAVAIPRIGQEVIVDFLEGDPDQPIITGRVYNAEQMPPYDLPANMTQSGVKSRSSKGGGTANFNEIRMEDKKGSEQLFIHAEKNQDIEVENDETHWVGHDRTKTIDNDEAHHVKHDRLRVVDNDENITIHRDQNRTVDRDRSETVHRNKRIQIDGNHSENIDGAMSVTVGKTLTETVLINHAETVAGMMEITVGAAMAISVGGAMSEAVGGAKSESIGGAKAETVGKDRAVNVGKNLTETIKENRTVVIKKDSMETISGKQTVEVTKEATLKAKKVQITAEDEISLKAGDASIIMKKNGDITITGGKITVKGSGDVVVKGSKIAEN